MINYAKYLIQKKLIQPPYYVNFILGNVACAPIRYAAFGIADQGTPPKKLLVSAGGVGDYQLQTNLMALIAGGGVRVGLEDNIYYDRGRKKLATNAELLTRIVDIAKMLNYEPYEVSSLRKKLNLEQK